MAPNIALRSAVEREFYPLGVPLLRCAEIADRIAADLMERGYYIVPIELKEK